jgi:hypothetical protein
VKNGFNYEADVNNGILQSIVFPTVQFHIKEIRDIAVPLRPSNANEDEGGGIIFALSTHCIDDPMQQFICLHGVANMRYSASIQPGTYQLRVSVFSHSGEEFVALNSGSIRILKEEISFYKNFNSASSHDIWKEIKTEHAWYRGFRQTATLLARGNQRLIEEMVHEYHFFRKSVPSELAGTPRLTDLFISDSANSHYSETIRSPFNSEVVCTPDLSLDDLLPGQWMGRNVYLSDATLQDMDMLELLQTAFSHYNSPPNISQQLWTVLVGSIGAHVYIDCDVISNNCVTLSQQSYDWTSYHDSDNKGSTGTPIFLRVPASFTRLEEPETALCNISNSVFVPNFMIPGEYTLSIVQPDEHTDVSVEITLLKEDLRIIQYPTRWKRGGGCNIKESDQSYISWESVGNITGVSLLLTKLHATTIDGHGMLCRSNNSQR